MANPSCSAVYIICWSGKAVSEQRVVSISSYKSFTTGPACLSFKSINLRLRGAGVTARPVSAHTVNTSALVEINSYLRTGSRAAETEEDSDRRWRDMGWRGGAERMEKIFRPRLLRIFLTATMRAFSFHSWLEYFKVEPSFSSDETTRFTRYIYMTPEN